MRKETIKKIIERFECIGIEKVELDALIAKGKHILNSKLYSPDGEEHAFCWDKHLIKYKNFNFLMAFREDIN